MEIVKEENVLSIITVTFNAEKVIESTLNSILSQKLDKNVQIEQIIQDGKSTDNTLPVINRYLQQFNEKGIKLKIISEIDYGIYDAMNRAIAKAKGKWIYLLNAGDIFSNDYALARIVSCLYRSEADIIYCDYNRVNSYLKRKIRIPKLENLKKNMIFCHQAIFIRRNVYENESYDCKYKLVADYDLMLRLFLKGYQFEYVPEVIVDYDIEGVSGKNMLTTYREIYAVRTAHKLVDSSICGIIEYCIGMLKRIILSKMPQRLRWKLYRILKH